MPTITAATLLAAVLGFAVLRPRRLPEAVAAIPAALLVLAAGLVPWSAAGAELATLAPTVGFLAAILVLAHLADAWQVFAYAGAVAARFARGGSGRHPASRLLAVVFGIAATVTAVLSLDATVVLLTPVVLATATATGVRARPHVYACAHLANSASLLLPVSNLTNLLAFAASGLTFAGFAATMALPWLAVIAVEYLVFRWFFGADLAAPAGPGSAVEVPPPRYALGVLAATLGGFVAAEPLHVHPGWVAGAGALLLAVPLVVRTPPAGRLRATGRIAAETQPLFCLFVLALGVVVLAVRRQGLDDLAGRLAPDRADLLGLLAVAALAAILANLVNNLPATLVLLPAVTHSPGLVLAVLIGVNVGPNLYYVGSLATLLWRRILHLRREPPETGTFLRLGALTAPTGIVAGVVALWVALHLTRMA
ncbi:ArsB/NhaD family transporter [Plantactinospora sp. WMMC1484]|uniref:ArsB/NhaD family transporter n=1 Tax=Plantactinospora sp. WMMC1484 TaxID=3404122 RepID=UPI003BF5628C